MAVTTGPGWEKSGWQVVCFPHGQRAGVRELGAWPGRSRAGVGAQWAAQGQGGKRTQARGRLPSVGHWSIPCEQRGDPGSPSCQAFLGLNFLTCKVGVTVTRGGGKHCMVTEDILILGDSVCFPISPAAQIGMKRRKEWGGWTGEGVWPPS